MRKIVNLVHQPLDGLGEAWRNPWVRVVLAMMVVVIVLGWYVLLARDPHDDRYQDYLKSNPGDSSSQCAKPVSQRTGGWICPGT
jgi:hypothetical protein